MESPARVEDVPVPKAFSHGWDGSLFLGTGRVLKFRAEIPDAALKDPVQRALLREQLHALIDQVLDRG